eukprot:CCRYP_020909-RA/>CCRYP_020909-RA protein AED:0.14 eAED:0.14 QI:0/-1/0/1/-1/1/1/0/351
MKYDVKLPGNRTIDAEGINNTTQNFTMPHINLPTKRTRLLNSTGKFSFVHISKAAGSTWIRTLRNLHMSTCPKKEAGQEYPVWYQDNKICMGADYHMLSLRSPRHHVWSLFTECKYDVWGFKVTKGRSFPRSGNTATNDEKDFNKWLDHFLPMGPGKEDNYKCYHPANFQSRYLDSKVSGSHGVINRPNDTTRFEPNLTLATSVYWDQDFVGIVELHHESLCLLYHRLGPGAPVKARQYVNAQCVCPKPMTSDENIKQVHVVHHAYGHRKDLRNLPPPILEKIGLLTAVDKRLYVLALQQMMTELAWLESASGLDRRVLCDDVLFNLEPELEYLDVSIVQFYHEAKAAISV